MKTKNLQKASRAGLLLGLAFFVGFVIASQFSAPLIAGPVKEESKITIQNIIEKSKLIAVDPSMIKVWPWLGVSQKALNGHAQTESAGKIGKREGIVTFKRKNDADANEDYLGTIFFDCFPVPHGAEIHNVTAVGDIPGSCHEADASIVIGVDALELDIPRGVYGPKGLMATSLDSSSRIIQQRHIFIGAESFTPVRISENAALSPNPIIMDTSKGTCLRVWARAGIDGSASARCRSGELQLDMVTIWYSVPSD